LSLLGVYNTNDLIECTKVLPLPTHSYAAPDGHALADFANGGKSDSSQKVSDGDVIAS
jgi:hypothetical protein